MKIERLKQLSDLYGASGYEEDVAAYIEANTDLPCRRDGLGSLLTRYDGDDPRFSLLVAAHMDEVGFVVKDITEEGFLHLEMIGSIWLHVILGQPFAVVTAAKKCYRGIIGSKGYHGMSKEYKERVVPMAAIYLDLGVDSRRQVEEAGIAVGNMVVPVRNFAPMNTAGYYQGKALDDRYGVAAVMSAMEEIRGAHAVIYGAYTVMEEPGLRGARTAAAIVHPSLAIAVDTTLAGDTPADHNTVRLGGGVVISMLDSNTIYHRRFLRYIERLCREREIPYQYAVFAAGGTDAGNIHKLYEGAVTMTLSLPIRYMHTNASVINTKDGDACIALLKAIMEDLTYEKFCELEGNGICTG